MDCCVRAPSPGSSERVDRMVRRPPPPRVPRANGWSRPLHPLQVLSWAIFLVLGGAVFLIFIPLLPHVWKFTAYGVSFPGPPPSARRGSRPAPRPRPVHPIVVRPAPHPRSPPFSVSVGSAAEYPGASALQGQRTCGDGDTGPGGGACRPRPARLRGWAVARRSSVRPVMRGGLVAAPARRPRPVGCGRSTRPPGQSFPGGPHVAR